MFTSNEPGFRSRQCAFTKNQRLSFQWISPMNSVNSHKQSKVLRTVKPSWVICSLILLNSFQSLTEITNCKITTNLERSGFFFAFVYIQILFSVSSWDGNQMMSENHIVQKLLCLIHLCIDTTTKERIKDVPANYVVKRSNKSAVSSLVHLHIFLFFSNRPVKSLLVHPVIQKGAICVTLNAIFKTIRHEIQVEIWEIWWRSI